MNFVFILYSEKLDSFYKGQTDDIEQRLKRHNGGLNDSTKRGIPWTIIWIAQKPDRSAAMELEKKLKNLSRERTLQFMLKYEDGFYSEATKLFATKMLLTKSRGNLSGC